MRPDNTAPIIDAARRRHEITRAKAVQALRELQHRGEPVSFTVVANTAGISRSWLYTQDDLREEITQLREATTTPRPARIPATQRASQASLLRRLELAQEQIRSLRAERDQLRRQLAHALGDQRHLARNPPAPP